MNGKERVLAMFDGRPVDHLPLMPITMMFAADLAGVPYRDYASDHRALAESQVRVAETFGFDYVSAISDPAREVSDLGGAVEWFDNQPPAVVESHALLADKSRLDTLAIPDMTAPGRMRDRIEAVALLKERTAGALIVEGWVEGPCAMGADLRGLNTLMLDFQDDPDFVTRLFDFVVAMEVEFARAQVAAGADLIGIGDAAASLIGPRRYEAFVLPYEQRLVKEIRATGARVRLHICGNTRKLLRGMGSLGADLVDLDFLSPMAEGREAMGPGQALLGNLDPVRVLRDGTPETISAAIGECYREAGPRYVVGAGCEVPRGTPHENLRALTEFARTSRP
ncbi:MAG: uroporphyrinogen decarboxylase family protein [Isosphaeraceae bacterium]